ncbi:E3 ubiquitin-protein ligase rififylin isoform X2 [Sitophilus oryzae]|uniref:E3 ubiquitin-protein ligase rififylin isoform X2 n=1 Tax=Sitophilus oryzae TaxID=7048 RepID=A0A6J2Z009_SITOR|nr:E3 ubiquitin-protein ligase rififylin isoform X2 [Sitophilus oryzae]
MPCSKCKSDFTLFNWKIRCGECEAKYCNKCLRRKDGILYCEVCLILIKRPPDRMKLMELKVKELRDYLNKNDISTYGLVEKNELVDLFCNKHIPEKQRKGVDKLTANFGDPLKPINGFLNNLEAVITEQRPTPRQSRTSQPPRPSQTSSQRIPDVSPPQFGAAAGPSAPPFEEPTTSQEFYMPTASEPPVNEQTPGSSPLPIRRPKLEDFDSSQDLQQLSSKELKILLTIYRVDYRGCIEKYELLEKAQMLWEDNNQHKDLPEDVPVQELCKLCMDAPLDCVLLECGHITSCIECGKKLAECPICRQYVVRVVRTFKA